MTEERWASGYPPWRLANWRERIGITASFIAALVICLAMFGTGLYIFGASVDGIIMQRIEHDVCLKHATNGYDIKQCR